MMDESDIWSWLNSWEVPSEYAHVDQTALALDDYAALTLKNIEEREAATHDRITGVLGDLDEDDLQSMEDFKGAKKYLDYAWDMINADETALTYVGSNSTI